MKPITAANVFAAMAVVIGAGAIAAGVAASPDHKLIEQKPTTVVVQRRQDRERLRRADQEEQVIRRARRYRHCYAHVLEGRGKVAATRGDLCVEHFRDLRISHPGV